MTKDFSRSHLYVSRRATAYGIEQFARLGLPTARLAAGLEETIEALQSPVAYLSWGDYLVFFDNARAHLTPEQFVEWSSVRPGAPSLRPLWLPVRPWTRVESYIERLASPADGAMHQLFPCMETHVSGDGEQERVVHLRLCAGLVAPPEQFWRYLAIGFETLILALGFGRAVVGWEPSQAGASFRVRLPRRTRVHRLFSRVASRLSCAADGELHDAALAGHAQGIRLEEEAADRRRIEASLVDSRKRLQTSLQDLDVGALSINPSGLKESSNSAAARLPDLSYFHRLVESAGQGIGIAELDGSLQYLNPAFRRILELSDDFDVAGHTFWEFIPPEDHLMVADTVLAKAREVGFWTGEFDLLTGAGRRLPIINNVFLLRDSSGEVVGLANIAADVANLKRVEAALRKSEERVRMFIEYAPAGVAMFDRELRYIAHSRRWLKDYGLEGRNLVGKTHYEVFPDIPERWKKIHQRCLTGLPDSCEEDRFDRADGSSVYLRWQIEPWFNDAGEMGGLVFFTEVITDRVLAAQALRVSERRLQEAQRIASIGNWELDLTTDRLWWSDELFRMFEVDPERFGASYEAFLQVVHPDDRAAVNAAYTQSLQDRKPYQITHRLQFPDGRLRYVEERCQTEFAEDGRPLFSQGTAQDVTRRIESELALRESQERLSGILTSTLDAVISVDEHGIVFLFNRAAEAMFGMSAEEAVGKDLSSMIPPEARERHGRHIEEFAKTGTTTRRMGEYGVVTGLRRNGELFPVEASISRYVASGRVVMTAILRDVTERQRAQQAIQSAERRQRLALDAARMGTWDWEIGSPRVIWDDRQQALFGFPPGEFDGTIDGFLARQADRILIARETGQNAFERGFVPSKDESFSSQALFHGGVLLEDGQYQSSEPRGDLGAFSLVNAALVL